MKIRIDNSIQETLIIWRWNNQIEISLFFNRYNQSDHFLCYCNIPCPLSWYVLELKDRFATFMLLLLLLLLLLLSSLLLLLILLMMLTMVFKETSVNVIKLDIEKHFSPNPRSSPFKVSFCNIFIIYFYAVPLKFQYLIKIISSQQLHRKSLKEILLRYTKYTKSKIIPIYTIGPLRLGCIPTFANKLSFEWCCLMKFFVRSRIPLVKGIKLSGTWNACFLSWQFTSAFRVYKRDLYFYRLCWYEFSCYYVSTKEANTVHRSLYHIILNIALIYCFGFELKY